MTPPVIMAGAELKFTVAELLGALLLLGVVVSFHIAVLTFIISGHRKLWRTKRANHLAYVLPVTWYAIALTAWLLAWKVYPDVDWPISWPIGRHPEFESNYLFVFLAVVLASAHGFLLERLLREPGRPTLYRLVLISAGCTVLLPPLGFILAYRALRRIRNSEGRLYGRGGAWSSLAINGLVLIWLLVGVSTYLYDCYESGTGPFAGNPVAVSSPPGIPASPPEPSSTASVPASPGAMAASHVDHSNPAPANLPAVATNLSEPDLGSGPFSGKWIAQFTFVKNTRNPAEPGHPWFAFACTMTQRVAAVHGSLKAVNGNVSGVLSGSGEDGQFHGTMRLSWDQHDWEELTLNLNEDAMEATGQAVFRASENERHYYNLVLRREHR
jgi:hypothetical protein